MRPTIAVNDGPQPPPGCLADGDVRFVGDPIAIVMPRTATSRRTRATRRGRVRREAAGHRLREGRGRHREHRAPGVGTNVGMQIRRSPRVRRAELRRSSTRAAHVSEQTHPPAAATSTSPMETRGDQRELEPGTTSSSTCWMTTQNQSDYRACCSRACSTSPEHKIRVVKNDVGGGFGQKGITSREDLVRRAVDVPARPPGEVDRRPAREPHRVEPRARSSAPRCTMAFDADGRLLAHGHRPPRRRRRVPASAASCRRPG